MIKTSKRYKQKIIKDKTNNKKETMDNQNTLNQFLGIDENTLPENIKKHKSKKVYLNHNDRRQLKKLLKKLPDEYKDILNMSTEDIDNLPKLQPRRTPEEKLKNIVERFTNEDVLNQARENGESFIDQVIMNIGILKDIFYPKDFLGELENWQIINSPLNRDPNLEVDDVVASKLSYALRMAFMLGEYMFLPVTIFCEKVEGKKFPCLAAKDRGHISTIIHYFDKKYNSDVWKKAYDLVQLEKRCKDCKTLQTFLNETLVPLMDENDKFSLNEALTTDVKEKLFSHPFTVSVKVETIECHKQEIHSINAPDGIWQPHQYGITEIQSQLMVNPSDVINVDEIYKSVCKHDVFTGKCELFSNQKGNIKKMSNWEDEVIWSYISSKHCSTPTEKVNYFCQAYKNFSLSNIEKRKNLYTGVLQKNISQKVFTNSITLIKRISERAKVKSFNDTISNIVTNLKKQDNSKKYLNIDHLNLSKLDSGSMFVLLIDKLIEECKFRNNKEWVAKVTDKLLDVMTTYIEKKSTQNELNDKGAGIPAREKYFWTKVFNQTKNDLMNEDKTLSDKDKKLSDLRIHLDGGMGDSIFTFLDRIAKSKPIQLSDYGIGTIDLNNSSTFQDGHMTAGSTPTYDTMFLQFPKDNEFWKNTRNFEKGYWKEYLNDLQSIESEIFASGNREIIQAYFDTKKFCELMGDKLI